MSQKRQIVEKYHLFLFLVKKENLILIGLMGWNTTARLIRIFLFSKEIKTIEKK